MSQADTTSLLDFPGESPNELTHVSEVLKESGIPVAEDLKDRMMRELLRLTEEDARPGYEADRRRSA